MANDLTIYDTHAKSPWDCSLRLLRLLPNTVPARLRHLSARGRCPDSHCPALYGFPLHNCLREQDSELRY